MIFFSCARSLASVPARSSSRLILSLVVSISFCAAGHIPSKISPTHRTRRPVAIRVRREGYTRSRAVLQILAISNLIGNLRRDLSADGQRRGGRRAGCVQDVQRALAAHETEILHQFAFGRHRLGANTGAAGLEILFADLRHQTLKRSAKQSFAERPFQLLPTHFPVAPQKTPESGERQRVV